MAGMWELPQWTKIPDESDGSATWRTFRHSITVTDYTVHVLRDCRPRTKNAAAERGAAIRRGKWVAVETIPQLPITGLTRKILKAGGVI